MPTSGSLKTPRIISRTLHLCPPKRRSVGSLTATVGLPRWLSGKESACQCKRCETYGFDLWVKKIPWRWAWQPTLVFLPGDPKDRGAWWTIVHRVTKSRTQLKQLCMHATAIVSASQSVYANGTYFSLELLSVAIKYKCTELFL